MVDLVKDDSHPVAWGAKKLMWHLFPNPCIMGVEK